MAGDVELVRSRVETFLRDELGSVTIDKDGDFTVREGSARVFITVRPIGEEHVLVNIWSPLIKNVPASQELFEYLATGNLYNFGKLVAMREDDGKHARVVMSHVLLGDYLDPQELALAVAMVVMTADEVDTEIRERFGGETFHDDP